MSRCPVCLGKGEVKKGFYPSEPTRTSCRGCNGTGVVYNNLPAYPYVWPDPYPWTYPARDWYPYYPITVTWGGESTTAITKASAAQTYV